MLRRRFWPVLLVTSVLVFPLAAGDAKYPEPDWPRFRGPNGDGISTAIGLLQEWPKDGPPLVWKSEPVGVGYSSVSMAGSRVFTMGDDKGSSWAVALDRNTGKIQWSTKVGKPGGDHAGTRCTPTLDEGHVYALGQFGDLVCLEAATGAEIWRKNLAKDFGGNVGGWNYCESPLIDGDKLVCTPGGRKKGALVALDKRTGSVIWESDFGESAGYASMVVSRAGGMRQYVQLLAGGLVGVSASDGKLLWRFKDPETNKNYFAGNTANISNPVVLGDYIFAGAGYGRGGGLMKLAADGASVREEWVYFKKELQNRHGGYVVIGDYVYADRDDSGNPFCANWKTGDIQWRREGNYEGRGSVSITYADGRLYMHYANGYVALVEGSPTAYKEHGSFKIPGSSNESWAHPVIVGAKLYVRDKTTVWCYDVKAK